MSQAEREERTYVGYCEILVRMAPESERALLKLVDANARLTEIRLRLASQSTAPTPS